MSESERAEEVPVEGDQQKLEGDALSSPSDLSTEEIVGFDSREISEFFALIRPRYNQMLENLSK